MNFIGVLNDLIKEHNISKSKFLSDLNLGKNSFVNWQERGTIPSGDVLIKIADYLNVSVDYLLGRTEQNVDGVINNGSNNTIQNGNGNTLNSSSPLEDNEVWDTYSRLSTKDKLEVKLDIMNRGSK